MTNKLGHRIIGMSAENVIQIFGGHGICDHCGMRKSYGYLAPVMGRKWYCTQCKIEWENTGKFYPEDVQYESMILEEFKDQITRYEGLQMQT